jgi:PAS domain S-box-containing protein
MLDILDLEQDGLLNTFFENSYNSIAITDANLDLPGPTFLYVNPAFTKKTGYTIDDLKGKTPRILQGEQTNKDILVELKEKCKKGEFFSGSTVNYKKDGTTYHVEWNISPIKDKNGNITHYISIQKDITKEVEHNRLQEEQLKAQKMFVAQQSRMAIMGEMIDSVAHQWKQPLNLIKMYIDFIDIDIDIGPENEKGIEKFRDRVYTQIDHMNETLNEFRSFLRADKKESTFNVSKIFNSVKMLLKDEMINHQIELTVLNEYDFSIKGFENEFKHVIINLINNAKDAFISNKISNRKILIKSVELKDKYQIVITDNAGGISSDIIDNIFDFGFTTKSGSNGTGVGLCMSKKILNKHNADIKVNSENKKTTFTIEFENEKTDTLV